MQIHIFVHIFEEIEKYIKSILSILHIKNSLLMLHSLNIIDYTFDVLYYKM